MVKAIKDSYVIAKYVPSESPRPGEWKVPIYYFDRAYLHQSMAPVEDHIRRRATSIKELALDCARGKILEEFFNVTTIPAPEVNEGGRCLIKISLHNTRRFKWEKGL